MDTRRAKQLIYGALYAVVWIIILGGIYFWSSRPVPTCFDGIQNQGEGGVDCGGPCALVCVPANIKAISTDGYVYTFSPDPGHATALVQVKNTNIGFASPSFDYRFDLMDSSGNIVRSVNGQSFIYSGEVKYLLAPNVSVASPIDHATLAIWNPTWTDAGTMGLVPQFALQYTGLQPAPPGTLLIGGEIKNNDLASFDNILVIGIMKGVSGLPIGASQTTIDHLAPDGVKDFAVMYPAVPGLDPSLTQFYAYAVRK